MRCVLALRGLRVSDGARTIVPGVDLDVYDGQVTALSGPSGVGKSVTARACMGIVDFAPGVVAGTLHLPLLSAEDWLTDPDRRRLRARFAPLRGGWMAYAPQAAASALNPGRTIGRQLHLSALRRTPPPSETQALVLVREGLAEVGLDAGVAGALPGEVSGGMCQRAALAIAVASAPRVLIADEPETGLDPVLRRQVVELLVEVGRRRGCGILLITHHLDTVSRIADHHVRLGLAA